MNTSALTTIGGTLAKAAFKAGTKIRKFSPELLLVGGIIAGGAAIVTACMSTKKVVEDEKRDEMELTNEFIQKQQPGEEQKKQTFCFDIHQQRYSFCWQS